MARLTHKDSKGWYVEDQSVAFDGRRRGEDVDLLAAYEDTGLEPEAVEAIKFAMMGKSIAEIKEFEGVPIDHLRELAQAERDGRLVVLPCKVGDTLYFVDLFLREIYKEAEVDGVGLHWTNCADIGDYVPISCIGETVFLTREEAEAALAAKREGTTG